MYLNSAPSCFSRFAIDNEKMYVNFALFYAAVAVFYFAFQFVRSRFQIKIERYTPPPTIDIVFIVRVFMQSGKWGLIMNADKHYLRLPMLTDMDENIDLGRTPSFQQEFDRNGKRVRIVVFMAPDELSIPMMMPKQNALYISSETVVDMVKKMRAELSFNSYTTMLRIQGEISRLTGKRDFDWFTGK